MTCPTRAFCTGRTSEIQAIFLVAILVPVTAWLWLLAVLDAVAAPTAGRAARLCLLSGVAVELQIQTREWAALKIRNAQGPPEMAVEF